MLVRHNSKIQYNSPLHYFQLTWRSGKEITKRSPDACRGTKYTLLIDSRGRTGDVPRKGKRASVFHSGACSWECLCLVQNMAGIKTSRVQTCRTEPDECRCTKSCSSTTGKGKRPSTMASRQGTLYREEEDVEHPPRVEHYVFGGTGYHGTNSLHQRDSRPLRVTK